LSLITSTSAPNQFLNAWKVLPYIELTDITLKYTQNANFIVSIADTVNISNVYLEGLSIKDVTTTFSVFRFSTGHLMNVYNVTANNVTGPIISTNDVIAQNFSTFSLNNMYTSQELDPNLQSMIYVLKNNDFGRTGLDPSRSRDTFLDNINLSVRRF